MSKKSTTKKSKAPKLDNSILPGIFESISAKMDYNDYIDTPEELLGASHVMGSIIKASVNLTRLVIENKIRNSEKISDNDIYKVYSESASSIFKTYSNMK